MKNAQDILKKLNTLSAADQQKMINSLTENQATALFKLLLSKG